MPSFFVVLAACWPASGQGWTQLTYLGNAGWEISNGKTTVLVDPYLTRLKIDAPNDAVRPDDPRPLVNDDDTITTDRAVVDAHIKQADFILVTHTHYDHVLDVPYIAQKTGARVIGTESTITYAHVSGVPDKQLLRVKGGEDLALGAFSLRVIPSLHGLLPGSSGPSPSIVFPEDAKPPFHFDPFVEGGTLAYLIRIGGHQILVFGSMNYIERAVEGLRPDVAIVGAMPERSAIYQYTSRLMHALGDPPLVIPTHWDAFNVPYELSQQSAIKRLQSFIAEVKAASPKTRVIVPEYFKPITLPEAHP